jgi:hypothetical protein
MVYLDIWGYLAGWVPCSAIHTHIPAEFHIPFQFINDRTLPHQGFISSLSTVFFCWVRYFLFQETAVRAGSFDGPHSIPGSLCYDASTASVYVLVSSEAKGKILGWSMPYNCVSYF